MERGKAVAPFRVCSSLAGSSEGTNLASMFELAPEKWTMQGFLWGFLVFGALIAGTGLIWTTSTAWFLYSSEKTTGVIVDVIAIQSTRSPGEAPNTKQVTNYYPVVEFRDSKGVVQQSKSSRGPALTTSSVVMKRGFIIIPKIPRRHSSRTRGYCGSAQG